MEIQVSDLEVVIDLSNRLIKAETEAQVCYAKGSCVFVESPNGYFIGKLIFDGDFWTLDPEGYGNPA